MFKSLLRDRKFVFLLALALAIKIFSLNEAWVETYYTYGFYPFFSKLLRILFGWIPFSIGDLVYIGAFVFLVVKAWKFIRLLAKKGSGIFVLDPFRKIPEACFVDLHRL